MNYLRNGIVLVILGNILVSFDSLIVKIADVGSWNTAFWFGFYSSIVLSLYTLFSKKKVNKKDNKALFLSGLLISGSVISFILSLKLTSVANTAVLSSSAPIFAAIFSWIILKEKTSLKTWLAILMTFIGILVVVSGAVSFENIQGDSLAVASAAIASMNFVVFRMNKDMNKVLAMAIGGALIASISLFFTNPFNLGLDKMSILAVMGLITAPWGRLASAVATRYISAAEVSMYRPLNTVLAPIWAWIFLSELPSLLTLLGGTIIITTLIVYTLSKRQQTIVKDVMDESLGS